MILEIIKPYQLIDSETEGLPLATIEPGTYTVERIPCPTGHNCTWIVLKGTKVGAAEGSIRQWENCKEPWVYLYDDNGNRLKEIP